MERGAPTTAPITLVFNSNTHLFWGGGTGTAVIDKGGALKEGENALRIETVEDISKPSYFKKGKNDKLVGESSKNGTLSRKVLRNIEVMRLNTIGEPETRNWREGGFVERGEAAWLRADP